MTKNVRIGLLWAILVAQLLALVFVVPARAVSILWSLTASPLTATTGVPRTFTMTATNDDPLAALDSNSEIGCIVLDVPGNFAVSAAAVTGSNAGSGWHVDSIAGNRVTVHSDSGGDRLEFLQWVRFTVAATPFNAGSLAWNARAFRDGNCTGGAALLGVPPIVVVTGPAATPTPTPTPTPAPTPTPTPTPAPTPTPTPTPTARPTPTPTPTPTLPLPSVPLPSVPLPSVPLPSVPVPSVGLPLPSSGDTPSPGPSEPSRPSPRSSQGASATPGGEVTGPGGSGGSAGPTQPGGSGPTSPGNAPVLVGPEGPQIGFDVASLDLGTVGVDLIGGLDVWTVPAATLGVPGILLLVWVAMQALGALAWIPAVRRLRSGDDAPDVTGSSNA